MPHSLASLTFMSPSILFFFIVVKRFDFGSTKPILRNYLMDSLLRYVVPSTDLFECLTPVEIQFHDFCISRWLRPCWDSHSLISVITLV